MPSIRPASPASTKAKRPGLFIMIFLVYWLSFWLSCLSFFAALRMTVEVLPLLQSDAEAIRVVQHGQFHAGILPCGWKRKDNILLRFQSLIDRFEIIDHKPYVRLSRRWQALPVYSLLTLAANDVQRDSRTTCHELRPPRRSEFQGQTQCIAVKYYGTLHIAHIDNHVIKLFQLYRHDVFSPLFARAGTSPAPTLYVRPFHSVVG